MAAPDVHTVTAAGVGVPYTALADGPLTVPVSRYGFAHFRNRSEAGDTVVAVPVAGPFGAMEAELVIPGGAERFVSLSPRLSFDGKSITFAGRGDGLADTDVTFLERDILDRA